MVSNKGTKLTSMVASIGRSRPTSFNSTATREDSDKRGLKPENLSDGNYILIQHEDGSVANYWHFQKGSVLVNVGDTVQAGQLILLRTFVYKNTQLVNIVYHPWYKTL